MQRKISFSLLAILVSGCLILSAGLIFMAGWLLKSQKAYKAPSVPPTPTLPVNEQMDQIQEQVSTIRGLDMTGTLDRSMMSNAELQEVVINDFFADYTAEDEATDVAELSMWGLLPADFQLSQFYKDLYSEQIAGFYDSETKEMNVISDGAFGGLERMTYAHEFTHVLQDQHYDLQDGLKLNDEDCETALDYCMAVSALVEGDATLSEQYWFLKDSTNTDKADVSDFQASYQSPVYDSAPEYMKQDFLFPYTQGFEFVNTLYKQHKWRSVDEAYQNPPVSSEQILHPELYPQDQPLKVDLPDFSPSLGEGWQALDLNTLGEWYTRLILSAGYEASYRLDPDEAATAADGWGGDTYALYGNGDRTDYVFVWLSSWDTPTDAEEFFSSSVHYGNLRWHTAADENFDSASWQTTDGMQVEMQLIGSDVFWLISSDQAAAEIVLSELDLVEY